MDEPSRRELEAAHCWEADDRVPGRPQMTAFRRRLRLHQARWREAHGHPIGSQPIVPRKGTPTRPVGSRLPLAYAQETGANFLTAGALAAARARASNPEPHQRFDHQRLWADLLWSPTLAFNLFGDLAADLSLADRAMHAWWPGAPGTVSEIRFAHSPGRPLQRTIARRAGIFTRGGIDAADRTDLLVTSLEHLLLLSMLQHKSGRWSWGRYVVVHPADNSDLTDVCTRYAELLTDSSTFAAATIEELLDAGALPSKLGERYIAG